MNNLLVFTCLLMTLQAGCGLIGGKEKEEEGIAPPATIYPQPYAQPSVSTDGEKLLFVFSKLTQLTRAGYFTIDPDSIGIWMANANGSNMKMLVKGQNFSSPSFSPDMNWLLFEAGAHIYKAPFMGDSVVVDSAIQLTNEGRNFFPSWSPDGEWIAYNQSICNEVKACGVWLFEVAKQKEVFVYKYGNHPSWHPEETKILFRTRAVKADGEVIGDSLWTFDLSDSTAEFFSFNEQDYFYPKYSPDGTAIAFESDSQVWVMNADGENLQQLTLNGGVEPSWSPTGEIIYVHYDQHSFDQNNGTLWLMEADGSKKQQLTFNKGMKTEE